MTHATREKVAACVPYNACSKRDAADLRVPPDARALGDGRKFLAMLCEALEVLCSVRARHTRRGPG